MKPREAPLRAHASSDDAEATEPCRGCSTALTEEGGIGAPPPRQSVAEVMAQLAPGQVAAAVDDAGQPCVVVRDRSGQAYLGDDHCPHDRGWLSDGFLEGDRLVCARHHWEFQLTTGVCPFRPERRIRIAPWPRREDT